MAPKALCGGRCPHSGACGCSLLGGGGEIPGRIGRCFCPFRGLMEPPAPPPLERMRVFSHTEPPWGAARKFSRAWEPFTPYRPLEPNQRRPLGLQWVWHTRGTLTSGPLRGGGTTHPHAPLLWLCLPPGLGCLVSNSCFGGLEACPAALPNSGRRSREGTVSRVRAWTLPHTHQKSRWRGGMQRRNRGQKSAY